MCGKSYLREGPLWLSTALPDTSHHTEQKIVSSFAFGTHLFFMYILDIVSVN